MRPAPIILFVYNRPEHTLKTLSALQKNDLAADSDLYIFSDGPKNESDKEAITAVRNIISTCTGFKHVSVSMQETNKGLAYSVINGVSEILSKHDRAIVLEDDILTAENFLTYMNNALEFYEDKKDLFSISGYRFPFKIPQSYTDDVLISPRASSWGWATWKDRWTSADWEMKDYAAFATDKNQQDLFNKGGVDLSKMLHRQMTGQINSWAIRWCYAHFKHHAYCLYPVNSVAMNFGNDSSGVHSPATNKYHVDINHTSKQIRFIYPIHEDPNILKAFRLFFKVSWKDRFEYLINLFLK
ncbi:MAG: hypothetical protein ACTHJT_09060 [Cytophaga sp.]|uniref:hypothetical protein n=1 Tax=Cytophaga sp. TaxID=29535 RepID=UPI003F7EC1BB